MIQVLVHERRFGQKGKHRTKTESLEKQIAHRGTRSQNAFKPACHHAEHVHADFAFLMRLGQEIPHQTPKQQRIAGQKAENHAPAAQILQACTNHRRHQWHNHQNDTD